MSDCTGSFYINGVKLRSGQASCQKDGRTLTVVCGDKRPAKGEVHVNMLPVGTQLHLEGVTTPLLWNGRGKQARKDRHFDAEALSEQFTGADYRRIVAIAASNLSPDGAKESRGYARTVADSYMRTLDQVGIWTQLADKPGAMLSVSSTALLEQVGGNDGAYDQVVYQFARQVTENNPVGHTQLLRLIQDETAGGMEALQVLQTTLETAVRNADRAGTDALGKLHRHLEKLADVNIHHRWAMQNLADDCRHRLEPRGHYQLSSIPTLSVTLPLPENDLPEGLAATYRLSAQLGARQSSHQTRHFGNHITLEWCGIRQDGSVIVFHSSHKNTRTLARCTPEDGIQYTYPSVKLALAGTDGTIRRPQERAHFEPQAAISSNHWDERTYTDDNLLLDEACIIAGELLVLIPPG